MLAVAIIPLWSAAALQPLFFVVAGLSAGSFAFVLFLTP